MTLQHTAHFVVTYGMKLVVGHGGGLRVETVEAHGLVCVVQFGDVERVGLVIDQHSRVAADFRKVDNVIVHILVV